MTNDNPMNFVTALLVGLFIVVVVLGVLIYVFKPSVVNAQTYTTVEEGDTYYNYTTIESATTSEQACDSDGNCQSVNNYYVGTGKPGTRISPCDFYDNIDKDGNCKVKVIKP